MSKPEELRDENARLKAENADLIELMNPCRDLVSKPYREKIAKLRALLVEARDFVAMWTDFGGKYPEEYAKACIKKIDAALEKK